MKDTKKTNSAMGLVGLWREACLGIGLAAVLAMAKNGMDITPILLLAGIGIALKFLMDQKSPGTASKRFEPQSGSAAAPRIGQVSFDDIGGQEVAKRELLEALEFVRNMEGALRLGIRPLRGILLSGPPGTGKTLLAKAAAGFTGSSFISAAGSEFIEMYAGVGAQRVRQLFSNARKAAERQGKKSAIVFIDELEVVGGKRGAHTSHLEYDQTLNQILVEMDGIATNDAIRVLVIGATNRSDLLDPALLRPGRFDRQVKVDLPDMDGRLHILRLHTKNKPLAADVDLDELAKDTFGFSGAHIESMANEAAILSLRQKKAEIGMRELREAIDKVIMGERLDRKPTQDELKRIAIHETGHAMVSETVRPGSVSTITITSRGQALGYMRQSPDADKFLYTKGQLEDQIAVCLAGAIAEEAFFGNRSSGAGNDFAQAAGLAKKLIHLGMSSLGVVSEGDVPGGIMHDTISLIVSSAEARVRELVGAGTAVFGPISEHLLEHEKLDGGAFRAMLAGGPPPTPPQDQSDALGLGMPATVCCKVP